MTLPLEGLLVVAVEQAVAGPYATRQLVDLGARVIKIERPEGDFARGYDRSIGDELSSYFAWLNRGKESVILDLKSDTGRDTLLDLVGRADVFVHNLAPGAIDRLGVTTKALRAAHPRLIIAQILGYGADGPYAHRKAYDLLIQCEAGLVSVTGTPDVPVRVGISIADIAAGMFAYSGVLSALFTRERTGVGEAIEVSMLEALAEWMMQPLLYAQGSGGAPVRAGAQHPTIAPYGPFEVSNGTVYLAVQNEREWSQLCSEVLRAPDLATDPRFSDNTSRVAHREILDAEIAGRMATLAVEDAQTALEAAGIASARIRSLVEVLDHPQLKARDRWREVESSAGPVRSLLPPVTAASYAPSMRAIPTVGEHTASVLAWLGRE